VSSGGLSPPAPLSGTHGEGEPPAVAAPLGIPLPLAAMVVPHSRGFGFRSPRPDKPRRLTRRGFFSPARARRRLPALRCAPAHKRSDDLRAAPQFDTPFMVERLRGFTGFLERLAREFAHAHQRAGGVVTINPVTRTR
jgi:hypothetical protein